MLVITNLQYNHKFNYYLLSNEYRIVRVSETTACSSRLGAASNTDQNTMKSYPNVNPAQACEDHHLSQQFLSSAVTELHRDDIQPSYNWRTVCWQWDHKESL